MADLSDDIRSFMDSHLNPVTFDEVTGRRAVRSRVARLHLGRVATVVVLLAVAVPVGLALTSARSVTTNHHNHGGARQKVVNALDTTVASGSFDIAFSQQPPTPATSPVTTTTTSTPAACNQLSDTFQGTVEGAVVGTSSTGSASSTATTTASVPTTVASSPPPTTASGGNRVSCPVETLPGPGGLAISGQGTVDTDPFAMVVNTTVPGLGAITLRDDGTDIWELGGGDYGLAPDASDTGPGSSLSGFAGLVEGTLGMRQGALDMMVLASPTGYLELDESAITSADQTGTGTVDGDSVTLYKVTLSPQQEATVAGANTTQTTAIDDALQVLAAQGYTGTTATVAVDGGGYIRQITSTATFSDGSQQSGVTTFSNFGCAGTVLMPGQTGSTSPPASCVSPDSASPTITQTTAAPAS